MPVNGPNSTVDASGIGLACGTYWSFAVSDMGDAGIGGMTHDGVTEYEPGKKPLWTDLLYEGGVSDADGCRMNKQLPIQGYSWNNQGSALEATDSGSGRIMNSLSDIPQPDVSIDPGFPDIGKQTQTDVYGNIYCVGSDFWEKMPGGSTFNLRPDFGFPIIGSR